MKILLADDMKTFLDLGRSFLARAECELLTAATGIEAVKLAVRFKPNLILLDLEMPEMTGLEACRIIKANPELASTPVVIITATDRQEDAHKAGADDFVRKPVDEPRFLELVKRHVRIKERHEPRVAYSGPVSLTGQDSEQVVSAIDISPTGMALALAGRPAVGELLDARFALPFVDGSQQIRSGCLVVRHLEGGIAVRFYDMTSGAGLALREYIQRMAPAG